jgi:hypothetical protein
MQQYDVCWLRPPQEGLVVVLQSGIVDRLATRVVAPLSDEPHALTIDRLRFDVDFGSGAYLLQVDRLAAIDRSALGQFAGSLAHDRDRIKTALDLLFLGF